LVKALTIVLATAASLAASATALADTYYTLSNPRIIQVPQPGDDARRTQASLRSETPDDAGDEDIAPPRRAHRAGKPKAVTHKEPVRRKPFTVLLPEPPPPPPPEPTGPRRALLSAPPPPPTSSIHDGPTPLKPTPRFGQPLPEQPPALTTFTPPDLPRPATPVPAPVAAAMPEPERAPALRDDDNDDHLPPPGDPRLAPPEPKD
jgi:hypothetical protein